MRLVRSITVAALALVPLWGAGAEQGELAAGLSPIFALCDLLGREVTPAQKLRLAERYASSTLSLASLRDAASELGLPLVAAHLSVDDIHALNRPCIVEMKAPGEFGVVLDVVGDWVQMGEGHAVHDVDVVEKEVFRARFSGMGLVPDTPKDS